MTQISVLANKGSAKGLIARIEELYDRIGGGGLFTEGSVVFADSSGNLTEDNANLFWNDSSDILQVSNVLLNSTGKLQLGDSSTYLHQDGTDIVMQFSTDLLDAIRFKYDSVNIIHFNDTGTHLDKLTAGTADYDAFLVSDSGLIKTRTGAQVLSDIGGVGISGTDNRIVRMDGTTGIQDSLITIDDSNNITLVNNSTLSTTTTSPVMTFEADGDVMFSREVGIGVSPLSNLHVQEVNLSVSTGDLTDNCIGLFETTDAAIELFGEDAGTWGSGISLSEMNSGTLANKWGIIRQTSTTGDGSLRITYGTNNNIFLNTVAIVVNSSGEVTINTINAGVSDYDKFLVSDGGEVKFRTGAEVLSDIGGVGISGTDNRMVRMDGATGLQDSLIAIDDSGNVTGMGTLGVGTITTLGTYQLNDANTYIGEDVSSNMTFTDAVTGVKTLAELADHLSVSGTDNRMVRMDGATGLQDSLITIDDSNNITLVNNSTLSTTTTSPVMTFEADGDVMFSREVGIGVSPLSNLHVQEVNLSVSTGDLTDNCIGLFETTDAAIELFGEDAGTWGSGISLSEMNSGTLANKWGIIRQTSTTGDGNLRITYGTNKDIFSNSAAILIRSGGTLLLNGQLQFNDTNTYITEDGSSNLSFTDAVTGVKTLAELADHLSVSGTDNRMVRMDGTTGIQDSLITVDDSGNVGIGKSPSDELHVYNASADSVIQVESYTDNAYLVLNSNTDNHRQEHSGIKLQDNSVTIWEIYKTGTFDFMIYNRTTPAAVFLISDSDNSARFYYDLDVDGALAANTTLDVTGIATFATTIKQSDSYIEMTEISAPGGDPAANKYWIYVKDAEGTSHLYGEDDAGNVHDLQDMGGGLTIGDAITSGTANYILYEDASNQLAEKNVLQFIGASNYFGVKTDGTAPSYTFHVKDSSNSGLDRTIAAFEAEHGTITFKDDDRGAALGNRMKMNFEEAILVTNHPIFQTYVTGDTHTRFGFYGDGKQVWGTGSAVADVNLYRLTADWLKTDDSFEIGTDLQVDNDVNIDGELTVATFSPTSLTIDDNVLLDAYGNLHFSIQRTDALGANKKTQVYILPKGSGEAGEKTAIYLWGTDYVADTTNWEMLSIKATGSEYEINSRKGGGGASLRPIELQMSDTACLTIETDSTVTLDVDTKVAAAKDLDCYTNGGYFKPRRVSQSAQPTPDANELMVWRDSDDSKTYLVYNDTDEGVRKVEMT